MLTWICGAGTGAGVVLVAGLLRSEGVPGANDNLSAVAVAWALAVCLAVVDDFEAEAAPQK